MFHAPVKFGAFWFFIKCFSDYSGKKRYNVFLFIALYLFVSIDFNNNTYLKDRFL